MSETAEQKLAKKMKEIQQKGVENEVAARAKTAGLGYINLHGFPISPEAIALIPEEQAKALKAICFFYSPNDINVGVVDSAKPELKELFYQLEERHHLNVKVFLISEDSFALGFKFYGTVPKMHEIKKGVSISAEEIAAFEKKISNFRDLRSIIKGLSTTDTVSLIIAGSLKTKSSDIHIEAEEKDVKVRYRIDGELMNVAEIGKEMWKQMISRIKLISGLKINITAKPQDGRFTIFLKDEEVDVRVSTIPTGAGESVVMRILQSSVTGLEFEKLGLRPRALEILTEQINRPNGMIITTGPTSSGKTTTLYAVLKKLNQPGVKIITLEDPIEYKLGGINQSQVDTSKDYTFSKGLKAILRQDPDIVMVGEIRDLETADIAIQAALTGHLMLSTIHTNSAAGAIPRFLSMGVKPFLLSPALNAIMGQRLVRRLCPKCKKKAVLDEKTKKRVIDLAKNIPANSGEKLDAAKAIFYAAGPGCEACGGLGYSGRLGIYEIFVMNKEIEKIISETAAEYQVQEIAVKGGMVTMAQDGILKAAEGLTSLEEVFAAAE